MLSESQSKCWVRGALNIMSKSTMRENENTEEGRPIGLIRGGKMA